MRIGILTGGGDVPGLNACIKAATNRAVGDGHEMVGIRRGWAGLLELDPADPDSARTHIVPLDPDVVRTIDRTGGTHPPHLPNQPREGPRVRRAGLPEGRPRRRRGAGPHATRDEGARSPRDRRADPDRRRRHAVVRAPAPRRGRPSRRGPEDDGQRRPRHRLLHRVLDRGYPDGDLHPPAADERRLARASRRRRGLRSVQR